MKKLLLFLICSSICVCCQKNDVYDDSGIIKDLSGIESRLTSLESYCYRLNDDIASLNSIVEAIQKGYYVSDIQHLADGYNIRFSNGSSINVSNGINGKDGSTPVIGVKLFSDGLLYWTVNDEWLIGPDGQKVRVTGQDGKDGVNGKTPVLKIEESYWFASMDDGSSWQKLGKATGENGTDGKDGEDGANGKTPVLKIEDGYWFVSFDDGSSWQKLGKATGENGANGKDGEDGVNGKTPVLKIEEGYWFVSVDESSSWQKLGKATGENGTDGKDGDSFFASVQEKENIVIFTLANGTVLKLPKIVEMKFIFSKTSFHPTTDSMTIPFKVEGAAADLKVVVFADASLKASVQMSGSASGTVNVNFLTTELCGNILVVARSNGKTITELIDFEKGILSVNESLVNIEEEGGTFTLCISHNIGYSISSDAEWIHIVETKSVSNDAINVVIDPTTVDRTGSIIIQSDEDGAILVVTVKQEIIFALEDIKLSLVAGDSRKIGLINKLENKSVTWTSSNKDIVSVNSEGIVTANNKGNATITVMSSDGRHQKECEISVKSASDLFSVWCGGGSMMINGDLLLYGSSLNWFLTNSSDQTIVAKSVQLVDGATGSGGNILTINEEIASGTQKGWSIRPGIAGIHLPITARFVVVYNGKEYTVSGSFNR